MPEVPMDIEGLKIVLTEVALILGLCDVDFSKLNHSNVNQIYEYARFRAEEKMKEEKELMELEEEVNISA
jgi:hypothetical protein